MSIATSSRVRNEMCTMRICVDDHTSGEISGRIFNSYYREPFYFDNWIQLIKQMNSLFSDFGYPHETMTMRSFEAYRDEETESSETSVVSLDAGKRRSDNFKVVTVNKLYPHASLGKLGTFDTKVMFRQNASWQGRVRWVELEITEEFQSAIELMYLIENSFDA